MAWPRPIKRQPVVVCVDAVNIWSGLRLWRIALRNSVTAIRILGGGDRGLRVLRRMSRCRDVQRLVPDLTSQMPGVGALYDWLQLTVQQAGRGLMEALGARGWLFASFAEGIAPKRVHAFWRKLVQREIYEPVLLALIAQQQGWLVPGGAKVLIVVNVADLAPALTRAVHALRGPWTQLEFLGYADARTSSFVRVARFGAALMRQIAERLVARMTFRRAAAAARPATVALEYVWGLSREAERWNDLWWYRASNLPPGQCLVFFDRPRSQATDDAIAELARGGYRYRILDPAANATSATPTGGFPAQPLSRSVLDGLRLARLLLKAAGRVAPAWQLSRCTHAVRHMRRWQAFMEAERITVLFSVEETSLDAMSLAADLVGAIRLGYHWSQLYPTSGGHLPLHQVYGVWGQQHQGVVLDRWGSCAEVILQTGCIFFHRPPGGAAGRQGAAALRRPFGETRRVIGVLDRSLGHLSYYSATQHREFYDALLTCAESNPSIGLLIKPKHATPKIFASTPALSARLEALMAAGRAVLLEGHRSVREAALASDLVVALGYNSGGVVAALAGARTVFWDPARVTEGPLSDWFAGANWHQPGVMYAELHELRLAIEQFVASDGRENGVGDLSEMRPHLDPFQDGQAAGRLGLFVRSFVEAREQGLGRDAALRAVVASYRRAWGDDKAWVRSP